MIWHASTENKICSYFLIQKDLLATDYVAPCFQRISKKFLQSSTAQYHMKLDNISESLGMFKSAEFVSPLDTIKRN